jgi:hypothetical protein
LATIRLRRIVTALAVIVALAATAAAPALATPIRVEGPRATIYQGNLVPATGALRDNTGVTHYTTKQTALGALVAASRSKPFPMTLGWFDIAGGGWNGFFLRSINGVTPPATTAGWFTKVNQRLLDVGSGAAAVTKSSTVLVFYSTYDEDFQPVPTLAIGANRASTRVGLPVTVTVNQFDNDGVGTPGIGAWIWVNGVGTKVDSTGHAVIRLGKPGLYAIRATKQGTIRSRTVWVRAISS